MGRELNREFSRGESQKDEKHLKTMNILRHQRNAN